MKVSDESGNVYYSKTNGLVSSLAPFEAASQVRMLTPVLEDGTYTVTPAYYVAEEDRWYDVRVLVGNVLRYTLKVTNGYMRFTRPKQASWLLLIQKSSHRSISVRFSKPRQPFPMSAAKNM